jgi:hypothetical protein
MRVRPSRSFRPNAETIEGRCLATAHVVSAALPVHALATVHHQSHHATVDARAVANQNLHHSRQFHKHPHRGLPGGALGVPPGYADFGVVTVWNDTQTTVSFGVSASTFQNGQFFPFTLGPGQYQAYYAFYGPFGQAPTFQFSFDSVNFTNPFSLPAENTVLQVTNWVPTAGTEGFPYAITQSNGQFFLSPFIS